MSDRVQIPDIAVVLPDKNTVLGYVPATTEFTEDIRFNACSEVSFTTPQRIYNVETEQWEDNPVYDDLEKHRLIYLNDDTDYFRYPVKKVGDGNFYKLNTDSSMPRRPATSLPYDINDGLQNFQVQTETELYDVGTGGKYVFDRFSYIPYNDFGEGHRLNGSVVNFSHLHWGSGAATYNPYQACSVFFPVEGTDIIAVRTGVMTGETVNGSTVANGKFKFKWHIIAYTDKDAETMVGEWVMDINGNYGADKVWRVRVADIGYSNGSRPMANGGYVRFWFENSTGSTGSSDYTYTSSGSSWSGNCRWWYPIEGFCKIYSGERRVTKVNNVTRATEPDLPDYVYNKMRWFEIVSTSEEDDGIMRMKTVVAKSYEYTLSHTTFSVSESTLPLYIPDVISNYITDNSKWVTDQPDYYFYTVEHGAQRTPRGIINQILDYLPGWTVKYASSELMARYRTIEDADDVDIYTYLMNTIQSIYNCFIVFDTDDNTISFYTKTELAGISPYVALTWDNSIKEFEKENMDASYFTALRVHAGDDTYPFGTVNPTGSGMIYNFERIKNDLYYYLPDVPQQYRRTLAEAVTAWKNYYDTQALRGSDYFAACIKLMRANMTLIQADSDVKEALANYHAKADQINAYLKDDWNNGETFTSPPHFHTVLISERPRTVSEIKNDGSSSHSKFYHNAVLQNELASCADAYWKAVNRRESAQTDFNRAKYVMEQITRTLSLNPALALKKNSNDKYRFTNPSTHTMVESGSGYRVSYSCSDTTLLSAAEIEELHKYIVEGTWQYENASFSDTYNVSDIYETLREVMVDAKEDLDDRLSIANFDFTVDTANILAIPEFEWELRGELNPETKGLYLGALVRLEISDGELLTPMLLEIHRNFKDPNDFKLTFTTDMKRRPINLRFADLFGTINQTSVTERSFTYDT